MQKMELLRSLKLIFVLRVIWYQRTKPLFNARSFDVSCFSAFEADEPAPPVHVNVSGQSISFLTSFILCSYLFFLIDSWYLKDSLIRSGPIVACRIKLFWWKQAMLSVDSQNPLVLISNLASFSNMFHLRANVSRCNGWGWGLISTSWQTFLNKLAKEWPKSLCLMLF